MKAASIQTIKEELSHMQAADLLEICLRLAKYKKENKELLSYLLFEANDEHAFISSVKKEIDDSFVEINTSNPYFIKKSLRKILRTITKYSKHTGSKQSHLEMLIHFCKCVKEHIKSYNRNTVLNNLYDRQVIKIKSLVPLLHEDLQFDYTRDISLL